MDVLTVNNDSKYRVSFAWRISKKKSGVSDTLQVFTLELETLGKELERKFDRMDDYLPNATFYVISALDSG